MERKQTQMQIFILQSSSTIAFDDWITKNFVESIDQLIDGLSRSNLDVENEPNG